MSTDLEKIQAQAAVQQQPGAQGPGPLAGPPGPPGAPGGPRGAPLGPDELFRPKSVKFWLTLVCNFLALFLVALDRTIIATAVPRISDEFQALGDIGWYGSAYMLTTACAQLVYGRIYKFYDMKWTFIVSIVVFEIGSAICGAAPSSTVFIIGRAIAGLASAGIFSGTMLIMIPMIPLHRRPAFQGLFGMVFGLASVMGPLIGGGFTDGATWRWCFYINLPIGAVSLVFMVFFWNPPKEHHPPVPFMQHVKRLDPIGMLFFLPGCVCLLLALQWGGSTYDWGNWRIVMLFGVCVAATIAFISVQIMKPDTAMVPPKIITQRSVAFGVSFTFFLAGSMLMMVYFVPIWFQTVKQTSAINSGIYNLPLVLSLVVSSIAAGIITQKIGYYVPSMLISPAIMSIGEGLMTTFNRDTPPAQWIAYQFIAGFGLGFGMQTSGLAIQTVLPREDVSIGIAINFFVQQLGGAISTSIGQTILSNLLAAQLKQIPGFSGDVVVTEGATHLIDTVPEEFRHLIIDAYNFACQRIFLSATCMAFAALLCALGMEWKSIKKGAPGQGGPPGAGGPGKPVGPGGLNNPSNLEVGNMAEGRRSTASGKPTSSGADTSGGTLIPDNQTNSHYSMTGMPMQNLDPNNPYGQQVVYINPQYSASGSVDPNNPYGMGTPMVYANSPYNSGMIPVPVVYVNPQAYNAIAAGSVPDLNAAVAAAGVGTGEVCQNCRCSMVGAPHPLAMESTTSLALPLDEKKGGRSRSGSASDDHR
ncbi:putative aflatoxin efflux pump [Lasiosphaeria hispida]|uniref:Aflatoxin efflux pump n=1 Tax=Lasiosphaeria hispida TaxID=260671 RepID=A0AAJ0ME77_9PEZI|nr:putative aflatoxin efflux pump [Lasiosphaeria hispida]